MHSVRRCSQLRKLCALCCSSSSVAASKLTPSAHTERLVDSTLRNRWQTCSAEHLHSRQQEAASLFPCLLKRLLLCLLEPLQGSLPLADVQLRQKDRLQNTHWSV